MAHELDLATCPAIEVNIQRRAQRPAAPTNLRVFDVGRLTRRTMPASTLGAIPKDAAKGCTTIPNAPLSGARGLAQVL
jgi:hypothetical protein